MRVFAGQHGDAQYLLMHLAIRAPRSTAGYPHYYPDHHVHHVTATHPLGVVATLGVMMITLQVLVWALQTLLVVVWALLNLLGKEQRQHMCCHERALVEPECLHQCGLEPFPISFTEGLLLLSNLRGVPFHKVTVAESLTSDWRPLGR